MNSSTVPVGRQPPLQARSRAALEKVLESAEHVLAAEGHVNFTMNAVAEHAGVSVGAIYRRFEGKEQLVDAIQDRFLTRLEETVAGELQTAPAHLAGVVDGYATAVATSMTSGGQAFAEMLRGGASTAGVERGQRALLTTRDLFTAAITPHFREIRRSDKDLACTMAWQTITSGCVHRTTLPADVRDDLTWDGFAAQLSAMSIAYLTTPDEPHPRTSSYCGPAGSGA